jgi:hypothetical protein
VRTAHRRYLRQFVVAEVKNHFAVFPPPVDKVKQEFAQTVLGTAMRQYFVASFGIAEPPSK